MTAETKLVERLVDKSCLCNDGLCDRCDDLISAIRDLWAERDALKKDAERLTFLDSQRKWGDCFAVQYLDSGDVYVRPWRYANQSITYSDGRRPHAATVVAQTIREAIDAALAAQEPKP